MTHLKEILQALLVLVPLSIFGLWRWSMWLTRKLGGLFYRPVIKPWPKDQQRPTVSLVVPVYNEDPAVFALAMKSWLKNGVDEIVAVIDSSNVAHIVNFERQYKNHPKVKTRLIVTKKPGKRPALVDGILQANGDIIALVDSDTIWADNTKEKILPYFLQKNIGGVSAQQRIFQPKTIAQVLFDIVLWTRYNEELPFLLGAGQVVNTLSGRTAFYRREALLDDKNDNMHCLTHEFYFKSRCISGDDKRLTHLILEQGWLATYAKNAMVYTPGMKDIKSFLKQRLRWTRNSWRADTRAFQRGWMFRHPTLSFFNLDRFLQPFFMLIGPIVFVFALYQHAWITAGILALWWCTSRTVRLFGYFRENPKRLIYLPAYIIFSYYNALMKIYAWSTILEQGWITRWDEKRLNRAKRKSLFIGLSATVLVVLGMILFVNWLHLDLGILVKGERIPLTQGLGLSPIKIPEIPAQEPKLHPDSNTDTELAVYTVAHNDNIMLISKKIGIPVDDLERTNNLNKKSILATGDLIYYFPK